MNINEVIMHERDDYYLSVAALRNKIFFLTEILKEKGISPKDRVAVYLSRGIDSVAMIYAIISIGATYVPLNKKDPDARILNIINDSNAKLIIGSGECQLCLKRFVWLDINNLKFYNWNDKKIKIDLSILRNDENPAVILYTSGSTGCPKGVVISHRAIRSFTCWTGEVFNISAIDRLASLAPLNFDISFFDIFTSLNFGSSVYFMPDELTMSPSQLTVWLAKHEISVWYTVPSMLSFWALKGDLKNISLSKLRIILFAGEVLPTNILIKLTQALPHVEFYNLYGPTETNVCCYWKVDKARLLPAVAIPIGNSACSSQLKVSNINNELLMKGPNLMTGYWNGVRCILPVDDDGWFHTGDEVKVNERGEYLYVGRLDRMIKYFGYRIEPTEIEVALCSIPEISECAVVGFKGKNGETVVGAYIVAENITSVFIKKNLKRYLPDYMIPTFFYITDTLPKLANGKSDLITIKEKIMNKYME